MQTVEHPKVVTLPPNVGTRIVGNSNKLFANQRARAAKLLPEILNDLFYLTVGEAPGAAVTNYGLFTYKWPEIPFSNRTGDDGKTPKEYHYMMHALRLGEDLGDIILTQVNTRDLGLGAKVGKPFYYARLSDYQFNLRMDALEKVRAEQEEKDKACQFRVPRYPNPNGIGKFISLTELQAINDRVLIARQSAVIEGLLLRWKFDNKPWYARLFERLTGFRVTR